jgi:hypothetical protein
MPDQLLRNNMRLARSRWHSMLGRPGRQLLKALTNEHQFSIANGDLIWLERGWYVTHTGLIRLARRSRCVGIHTKVVQDLCNPQTQRWAFEATVYKSKTCRGFVGYGDADPSNVSFLVHGAEMRGRRPGRSTGRCVKPTGLVSAPSRRSDLSTNRRNLPGSQRSFRHSLPTGTDRAVPFAIDSAKSSASISSIRTWSSLTRLTSAR